MKHVFGALIAGLLLSASATAQTTDLIAHARPRPPELNVENDTISGPLKDVLDEAARTTGLTMSWIVVPFPRSVKTLQDKEPVIVPRVIKTAEREQFMTFLTPIAEQKRHVYFIVAKGNESKISNYDSLHGLTVGTKRGTVYFDKFDSDTSIKKEAVADDNALCKMLQAGHIDVLASIDLPSTEYMMKTIGYTNFAVAPYHEDFTSGNYFAIAKDGPLQSKVEKLNAVLKDMVSTGKIEAIYRKYKLDPSDIKE